MWLLWYRFFWRSSVYCFVYIDLLAIYEEEAAGFNLVNSPIANSYICIVLISVLIGVLIEPENLRITCLI